MWVFSDPITGSTGILARPGTVTVITDGLQRTNAMHTDETVVAVFDTHMEADAAIRALATNGFAAKHLSLVGKGYHTEEKVSGFYNIGDRMKFWGSRGAFWGGMWSLFFGGLFLTIPVVGHVLVLGYLAMVAMSVVEGGVIGGGLGAIGAAIASIGIPRDSVIQYETAIAADHFLVMAHGDSADVERARWLLHAMNPKQLDRHAFSATDQPSIA
jgi:hypothetical protein